MQPVIEFRCVNGTSPPMFACGRCRMLGAVTARNNDRQAAERCCLCEVCGTAAKEGHYTTCGPCTQERKNQSDRQRQERLAALPEEDYTGGAVFVNDTFYSDLESALDEIDDLLSVTIHPCREGAATVPDLVTYVEEHLLDQFADADGPFLSSHDHTVLETVARQISPPRVWIPREDVRVSRACILARFAPEEN